MSKLFYYGYDDLRKTPDEIIIYTIDKNRLHPKGVIVKVLMNNLLLLFPNLEAFKKVGLKFAKFNCSDIPIRPQALCDLIEEVFNKDSNSDNITFGNYMYMFTEGIDYVVIFRLSHPVYGSQLSFLQEGFDSDKDYIFIIERSMIQQKV